MTVPKTPVETGPTTLLSVENLDVALDTAHGPARAVRGVSFTLERGETLGIVGESGCGKSMTALAIMGLLPEAARAHGAIALAGQDLIGLDEKALCAIRGNRVAMIFQEPMTSLNPVHPIGRQIAEPMRLHRGMSAAQALAETVELLDRVGLPNQRARVGNYPHQLSGGQRQRVMIAMALSCAPDILIADEPTTALDVTIQEQILDLIDDLVTELGMALILISHDLGVIAQTVDRLLVMYGGSIIEQGTTQMVFDRLAHPYSQGLFAAVPRLGQATRSRLATIPGTVPDISQLPPGCAFAERCPRVMAVCRDHRPEMTVLQPGHAAACFALEPTGAAGR